MTERNKMILLLVWISIGFATGFVSARLHNRRRTGTLIESGAGTMGSVVGGWLYYTVGPHSLTGANLSGMLVAFAVAVIFLLAYRVIGRR